MALQVEQRVGKNNTSKIDKPKEEEKKDNVAKKISNFILKAVIMGPVTNLHGKKYPEEDVKQLLPAAIAGPVAPQVGDTLEISNQDNK